MKRLVVYLYHTLRGSVLHPQWLTDRFHRRSRRLLRELHKNLVLDIGSGNSRNSSYLDSSNTVVTLDYPTTNRRYQVRPDVFGDATCLPVADGSFDAVFLFEVLEHIASFEEAIRETRRSLRARGKLFISVPFLYPIHDAPHDFHRFTVHGISKALETGGFHIARVAQHGNSLLVPIQLFNLALLEGCRSAWQRGAFLGVAAFLLAYPICLLNNLVALPLTLLPDKGAGCFGYFIVADRA